MEIRTGSMAYLVLEKRRWLIRSAQALTNTGSWLERFSVGGMTQI